MAEAEATQHQEPEAERDMADIMYPPVKDEKKVDDEPGPTTDYAAEPEQPDAPKEKEAAPEEPEAKAEPEKVDEEPAAEEPKAETSEETKGKPAETSDDDSSDEGEPISSFAELVEHYDLDPDWVMGLAVSAKANGQELAPSLKEALASYQTLEAAEMRLADAKDKSKTLLDEATAEKTKVTTAAAELGGLLTLAEKMFGVDANADELAKLERDDPVAYLTAERNLEKRRAAIAEVRNAARRAMSSVAEQKDAGMSEEKMTEEATALLKRIPEWKDEEVAKTESAKVIRYANTEYGVTSEEFENSDHRTIDMMRKAWLYDQGRAKVQTAKKKVVTIPKVGKTTGTRPVTETPKKKDAAEIFYGN